jgi:DNA-binding HxlR family transcriptional regulator
MRTSILGFNQSKAIELGLTTNDLLLLQYIMYANSEPTMKHIVEDEIAYVWLQHAKIQEDLPILNITEGTLKNKLSEFRNKGLIASKTVSNTSGRGSRAYYTITELTTSLINDPVNATKSLQNDAVEGPSHSKMTSNIVLDGDKELNFINEITTQEQDCSSKGYSKEELKEEFLGSVKKTKRRRPINTRPTLFDKCVAEIDKYTDLPDLRDKLIQFLKIRLEVKDKPFGIESWKGMLKKLDQAVAECQREYVDVVQQSIDKGWLSFYPINERPKVDKKESVFCDIDMPNTADIKVQKKEGNFSGQTF